MQMATVAPVQVTPVTPEKPKSFDPDSLAGLLREAVPGAVVSSSSAGIVLQENKLIDAVSYLKNTPDLGYDYLNEVTSVDWPDRFEVVYHLSNVARAGEPLPLKVNLTDKANPTVPSLISLYGSADQQEREVYDLMGIR